MSEKVLLSLHGRCHCIITAALCSPCVDGGRSKSGRKEGRATQLSQKCSSCCAEEVPTGSEAFT